MARRSFIGILNTKLDFFKAVKRISYRLTQISPYVNPLHFISTTHNLKIMTLNTSVINHLYIAISGIQIYVTIELRQPGSICCVSLINIQHNKKVFALFKVCNLY